MSAGAVAQGKRLAAGAASSHPVRVWRHYGQQRGGVLAGGIAYAGLFSVFSALLVGFTVLGLVLGRRSALQEQVMVAVDQQLPRLLDVGGDGGLVPPADLFADDVLSVTGAVALVVALVSGLGWLGSAREGIRAMFGLGTDEANLARQKARDVGVLATLGLAILASAVLSVVVNAAAGGLLDLVGLTSGPVVSGLLRLLGIAVVLVVDTVIFVILLRLLSGVELSWAQVRTGALVGAAGLGLLKLFGGLLLGRAGGSNPLLAASAVLVGLLVWMNLVSRVLLLSAAWVATGQGGAEDAAAAPRDPDLRAAAGTAVPAGPRELMMPSFGRRSHDRATLAAGAVLGALLLTGARVVRGAARAVGDVVRRDDA